MVSTNANSPVESRTDSNFRALLVFLNHRRSQTKPLKAGCELECLSPYSPDLKDIEHYWFAIKNLVRKSLGTIEDFRERVDTAVRLTS